MKHYYRTPALTEAKKEELLGILKLKVPNILDMFSEFCYNVDIAGELTEAENKILIWNLSETFEQDKFNSRGFLTACVFPDNKHQTILEVGPRMNFTTAWSANAVSVCWSCGLTKVKRIERSRRFLFESSAELTESEKEFITSQLHDRMTEMAYPEPLKTFETGTVPEAVKIIPLIEEGKSALEKINKEMGLGMDEWDITYYYNLFVREIGRNPTNVECFDLGQCNSEHSRHWFFKGRLIVDGREVPHTLMELVKRPLEANRANSVIAFKDNSSSMWGYNVPTIIPARPGYSSPFVNTVLPLDIIFTAETHNFPSGVAPFPGAETGTGGRIRDVEATGRGGLVIAGTAAYCVGNLRIPSYDLPWEDKTFNYPSNLASPLKIEIQASNGASDYGNKFGEPVILGFTRSFGMRLPNGERYEFVKPIMFTGGIGQMDARHIKKGEPEKEMLVVKIGGPAYRIGIGGGAASSMIQGANTAELDFNAVQRGDAEMEQKTNRVVRACVEMGDDNPIITIHDQGAGGNCNVVKEIIYPAGAKIEVRKIQLGDNTLSVLEIWGSEHQEQNALLLKPESIALFEEMCAREKVPCAVIGQITGDGYIVLYDENDGSTPVNLDLRKVLGDDMPQKTFHLDRIPMKNEPFKLPEDTTVIDALNRVLRLMSVGSKRFLTNKVDRSVTGLVARQQCAGPLQLTVSDCAVIANSHFGLTGAAMAIGERPILTLINPAAMARMSVGEALTNLVWAKISKFEDIKFSANWMWAAKLSGEGAKLYDAAVALSDILTKLGIAIDGGKDSLSMAAQIINALGKTETVKAPGTLVMSAYVTCPDITKVITPDIKRPGNSQLVFIDLSKGNRRLGGSALAQCYSQIGDECPDVEDPDLLKRAFNAIQELIDKDLILAGHDVSDGGLIVTLLEMAFAGNCGLNLSTGEVEGVLEDFFAEEIGLVIEVSKEKIREMVEVLDYHKIPTSIIYSIGFPTVQKTIAISYSGEQILNEDMPVLRDIWEETSYQLERLQCNPVCAEEEKKNIYDRSGHKYHLTFNPIQTPAKWMNATNKPKVAIIREEGSNGDREMTSAFYQAGFEPWDVTMTDLLLGKVTLNHSRGIAFVGGFSYADVLDSAKGWAGVVRCGQIVREGFKDFYERKDTFSLGICNGCQLMALLGLVPWQGIDGKSQPRFIRNKSGRFESRFPAIKILPSPSIMFQGMEGSVLGVNFAHGEGRAYFPDESILEVVRERCLAPARYVDDDNQITEKYPFNPNGSIEGIAALCSPDGRHLAIMPHPERTFINWQWHWMPEDWKKNLKASPWLKMFQNARWWCEGGK